MTWEGLTPPYATVVIDPPWSYVHGGPRTKHGSTPIHPGRYATMTLGEIATLPIEELAADDAHMYLWTTNGYLRDAYGLVEGWGFKPSQLLTWCKRPSGLGPGGAFATTTEFVLHARRGHLAPTQRSDSTWWLWPRRGHSVKPEEFFDAVELVSPGPYCELFARRRRKGWDGWGNEYPTDEATEVPQSGRPA